MARSPRAIGLGLLALILAAGLGAPFVAPQPVETQYRDFLLAPPMRPRIVDADGRWRRPFVYPIRLVDRLERRFEEDRATAIPLVWFSGGKLVRLADERRGPWLPLGADALGRDVLSRTLYGARVSLGVALVALAGALGLGLLAGAAAGYLGGLLDDALMRAAELVLVLPILYVVVVLRAAMPLDLPPAWIFAVMVIAFALVGWPTVARGVRAIVATEVKEEYAVAAVSLGAGRLRILVRHLLPATAGFLATQALLLLPAFVLAEATLSYVGFGFAPPLPSWGMQLQEAANVRTMAEQPWVLAPAAAIAVVVLALNLVLQGAERVDLPAR